jgi:hypothetical protein
VDKASFCCSGGNHPQPTIAEPRRSPTRHSRIRLKSGKFTGDSIQFAYPTRRSAPNPSGYCGCPGRLTRMKY